MREEKKNQRGLDQINQELDDFFRLYRNACPEIAASASFLPGMWERIESRRQSRFQLMHLSRVFLSGATAIWLLLAGFLYLPASSGSSPYHQGYIEALATAGHDTDGLSLSGLLRLELGEPDSR